jgi:uncharacterized protein
MWYRFRWVMVTCALAFAFIGGLSVISSNSRFAHSKLEETTLLPTPNKHQNATQNEWTLKTDLGVQIWMAQNETAGDLVRKIYLYLDAKDFTEENLKKVFFSFSEEYRAPYNLVIYCLSDKALIERYIAEAKSRAVYPKQNSIQTGFYRAVYYRRDGQESIIYNPSPDSEDSKTIWLKKKEISYSGNIDQDLLLAINEEDVKQVRNLISRGGNVNIVDSGGDTAFMLGVQTQNTEIMNELLKKTQNIDHRNNEGWTALMYAAADGNSEMVKKLLDKGADVNARNHNKYTPLMLAASRGQEVVMKLLLSKGADVNVKNNNGLTALSLVKMNFGDNPQNKIISLLRNSGAKE